MASINLPALQFTEIKKVLLLLDKKDRFRLFLVLVVNTLLAFLDLIGVALIGVATAILIRRLQAQQAGDQVSRFLEILVISHWVISIIRRIFILISLLGCI